MERSVRRDVEVVGRRTKKISGKKGTSDGNFLKVERFEETDQCEERLKI